jgi:hypothetical protein
VIDLVLLLHHRDWHSIDATQRDLTLVHSYLIHRVSLRTSQLLRLKAIQARNAAVEAEILAGAAEGILYERPTGLLGMSAEKTVRFTACRTEEPGM